MVEGRFVSYLRVSTERQGRSGLGLEAQRAAVAEFLNGGAWQLLAEFVEMESGKRADRPKLAEALAACRVHQATLVIAKLDRLARNAAFLLNLRDAGIEFVAADMPTANRLTVGILAMVAEDEAERISARTKAALAAAKARGVRLGGRPGNLKNVDAGRAEGARVRAAKADGRAADLAPILAELRAAGLSLRGIARALDERGIPAPRGGGWSAQAVTRLVARLGGGTVPAVMSPATGLGEMLNLPTM